LDAQGVEAKTIGNIHQAGGGKNLAQNYKEQIRTGPHDAPGNSAHESEGHTAKICYVEQPRFQGKIVRKNIMVNELL
jgi:hypothetical protein